VLNDLPMVRVITPIYGFNEHFVRDMLTSLSAQTYDKKKIEHIIVLDMEPDDGEKALDSLTVMLKHFNTIDTYIYKLRKHVGVSHARNVGLDCNTGEKHHSCVCFLDADNAIEEHFIETMVNLHTPNAVTVCNQLVFNTVIGPNELQGLRSWNPSAIGDHEINMSSIMRGNFIDLGCIMHPRCNVRFDPNLTRLVDWDYIIALSKRYHFYGIVDKLSYYRNHMGDKRICNTESYQENHIKVVAKWKSA